jgi:hypothetical protein
MCDRLVEPIGTMSKIVDRCQIVEEDGTRSVAEEQCGSNRLSQLIRF